ncbi:hypothetical protein D047_0241B, partial [Vibrio parahaemolyticus VPTS-2010_2]
MKAFIGTCAASNASRAVTCSLRYGWIAVSLISLSTGDMTKKVKKSAMPMIT